jgi:hypothetical protein
LVKGAGPSRAGGPAPQLLLIAEGEKSFDISGKKGGHRSRLVIRRLLVLAEPSQFDRSEAGMPFVFNKGTPKVSTTF